MWRTVFESSRVTGLGRGTKQTGLLNQDAIDATLDALRSAFDEARAHGASEVIAMATMAARIARNTTDFQAQAADQGTPVGVLSGEDEAALGFKAVADDPFFRSDALITIIDPGGQSTELVTAHRHGDAWDVQFRRSFPIGTLGLRGGVLHDETPLVAARLAAVEDIDRLIGLEYLPGACGRVVTLGATGTNLITIREGITVWDPDRVHGARLDYEEVGRAVGWLFDMTDAERAAVRGMEPGRASTIHIGTLVLERFLHAVHSDSCIVSVRGWRHALLESYPYEMAS